MLTMTEQVREVLDKSFEEVQASSLILTLLDCYSKLYLYGAQPGTCGACHRDFYIQLKINGMELAKAYEEAKNRTCKPAWKDLKYIQLTARHWSSELLTDKEAIMLLEKKFLSEKDFLTLPSGFGAPIPEQKIQEDFEKRQMPKKRIVKKSV
jgi:hypothetical protein